MGTSAGTDTATKLDRRFETATLWRAEAQALREVLRGCGLGEEMKWGKPTYTHGGDNLCIIQRMKPHLALMFFKGALLDDPAGVLRAQGPHSRAARRVEFTSLDDVADRADIVRALVAEAIRVEAEGLQVPKGDGPELPEELVDAFDADPELHAAFERLTPGRQRYYLIHFADAKRPETRVARIAKYRDRILAGKGAQER